MKNDFVSRIKNLKTRLKRSRNLLSDGLTRIMRGGGDKARILEEIDELLVGSDIGVRTSAHIVEQVEASGISLNEENVRKAIRDEIVGILSPKEPPHVDTVTRPHVIMVVGVNGTGKTTTIAKLARRLTQDGKKVLLAASDTFRAAAIEQLEIWAGRVGADIVKHKSGADAASVAYDAVSAAVARDVDIVIIDTAGRLQTKKNLMDEVAKIGRVTAKLVEGSPHEVLLVLDATTGQNAVSQARAFSEACGVTGLVVAKLDGTAKGGIVVAIAREFGIPILYIGTGETAEDLEPFDAEVFANALLS
ncbi:signal recognition particle-docking protein FtsY [Candidatus Eisenbacteria bacterium]|uniref:Signal recognition particle receptor FtsY n=1 Tax=Eiseniibacteriota bacterium TaxID=2212470 RepID=A0ABV6YPY7_UNCEI